MLKVKNKLILAPQAKTIRKEHYATKKHKKGHYEIFDQLSDLRKDIASFLGCSYFDYKICGCRYRQFLNRETEKRRYIALGCRQRSICPICGKKYWDGRAREVKSLFKTFESKVEKKGKDTKQKFMKFEFTLPQTLTKLLDDMMRKDRALYLNRLSHQCYRILANWCGVKKEEMGGQFQLHFWKTKDPLSPHYHFHLTVSPFKSDGSYIFKDLWIPEEEFEKRLDPLKGNWCEAVSKVFGIGYKGKFDVNYGYLKETDTMTGETLQKKCNNRFSYVCRHWTEDLLKCKNWKKRGRGKVLRALQRAKEMQKIKKSRYFGYFSPVKRKEFGIGNTYFDNKTMCRTCGDLIDTDLLLSLIGRDGHVECNCGVEIKKNWLGDSKVWEATGKTFKLVSLHKDFVVLQNIDVPGETKAILYNEIDLYPRMGRFKHFSYGDKIEERARGQPS